MFYDTLASFAERWVMIMKKVPYIEQMNQTECGLCCCLSILRYYGSKESLLDLRKTIECGRDGYSFGKIKKIFESRGIIANSYRVKKLEVLQKIRLPCIVFWSNDHFVVLYKITKKHMYIMNPARGYEKYRIGEFLEHFSNAIMVAEPKEDFKPRKSKVRSPWRKVFSLLLTNKMRIVFAVISAIISYIIMLQVPTLTSNIIDNAMNLCDLSNITYLAKILTALILFYLFMIMVRNTNIMIFNMIFCDKIEKQTFEHLLKLPYKFYDLRTSGDLLYRISSLSGFRELFTTQVVSGIVDIGTVCFILFFLLKKSFYLTVVVLLLSLFNVLFLLITKGPIARSINKEVVEQAEMQSVENECLITISSIKTAGIEEQIFENWYKHLKKVISCYKERYNLNNLYMAVTSTFQIFAPIVILLLGIQQYYNHNMTLGEVVAFESLASMLFATEVSIFSAYTQFVLASTYLGRVNDIWCEEEEKRYSRKIEIDMIGRIEIRNLSFAYSKDSIEVLHDINMKIESGQRIAIVGKSGSGKSTIGKVIAGLYSATKGNVYFDDIDINDIKKSSLCGQIGVVPQEVYLLNRSIRDNITMNNQDITEEEVINACKAVEIYDEIMQMPMGLNTIVSEMGLNLSGGQRQRIALAKVLLHKPKIVILDEATSALDTINEKSITNYLRYAGCTQIIVAHRLSTIIDAEQIYVLKDGSVVEQGTHNDLMDIKGEYYNLYLNGEERQEHKVSSNKSSDI